MLRIGLYKPGMVQTPHYWTYSWGAFVSIIVGSLRIRNNNFEKTGVTTKINQQEETC